MHVIVTRRVYILYLIPGLLAVRDMTVTSATGSFSSTCTFYMQKNGRMKGCKDAIRMISLLLKCTLTILLACTHL